MKKTKKRMPSLKYQKSDFLAQLAKSGLGAIPLAGSLLSEVASSLIPNQRIDRIVKFAEKLEEKLTKLDESYIRTQLTNENFVDVLEEGIIQAAKSLSEERREYISAIIANGLSNKEVKFNETRHFLKLLGEINDVEVILLRFYLVPTIGGDKKFRKKHETIIMGKPVTIGSPQIEKDKETIKLTYKEHLASINLLQREYESDIDTGERVIDNFTHAPKIKGYSITPMGKLLLKQMGFSKS